MGCGVTGNLYGADIEALRQLSEGIARGGDALDGVVRAVEAAMPAPEQWGGPDGEQFRQEWNYVHAAALRETSAALIDVAAKVRANADDQERTSEDLDGGGGGPLGAGIGAAAGAGAGAPGGGAAAAGGAGVPGSSGVGQRKHREVLAGGQGAPDDTRWWAGGAAMPERLACSRAMVRPSWVRSFSSTLASSSTSAVCLSLRFVIRPPGRDSPRTKYADPGATGETESARHRRAVIQRAACLAWVRRRS